AQVHPRFRAYPSLAPPAMGVAPFFMLSPSAVLPQTERGARSTFSSRPDPDGFDVEIFIELLDARLASIAAHLVSTERHCRVHGLITVDPDRTSPNGLGQAMRLADIACPDAAAQPEGCGIGPLGYLGNVREGNGGDDWAKDLF